FFNFSRGRYWTGPEEVFEPSETHIDFAIPPTRRSLLMFIHLLTTYLRLKFGWWRENTRTL
ncbi:MAG: hypothetical protein ACPLW8_04585, partial [Candidatus Bathyarchaeales archaeon]